ncbi:MAG: glucuronate isomerase [Clostridia bacterium]|nr:glucuronate isomerase [Clostridia bacterium]
MKSFLNEDFLLNNQTARSLYHECASTLPIIDYHCHVSPKEIYEDLHFENITQVWLYGDHYKWRIMRSNGVEERFITGNATDKEKFFAFASALSKAIGNPMYHWCHLELQRYFGYYGVLNENTAEDVWNLTCQKLKSQDMGVRGLIQKSNVCFIGTTDDPIDSLEWHVKIKEDKSFNTVVAPSFRPDKALNIEKTEWCNYIEKLSLACGFEINGLQSLKSAINARIAHFLACGCKASDHGLDYVFYREATDSEVDLIIKKALNGEAVSVEQTEKVKTNLLVHCAKQYARLGWVMQLHFNCMRNPNSTAFERLGPDSGFDCIGPNNSSKALAQLLDALYKSESLPKTVLYSLDGGDNAFLDTLIGAFQGVGVAGKMQHGSAWWFNDNKQGMREQLISLANLSLLGNFIGMLTDSRSFLSYTRHEYFRRILCGLIGEWVENGEYPNDCEQLKKLVSAICYDNAFKYFSLK